MGPRQIPEGAEVPPRGFDEALPIMAQVELRRLRKIIEGLHHENRRLRELVQAAGLDPDAPVDVLALRRDAAA